MGLIACKGDLAWFAKLGNFARCYHHLADAAMMCHECLAGTATAPFEDLRESPSWKASVYSQRPWNIPPCISCVPFDKDQPEKVFKRDVFHNTNIGVYRDFAASSVLLLCELKYFHMEAEQNVRNGRKHLLHRAYNHFKLYTLAVNRPAALRSFTLESLNCPTRAAYPWFSSKGSDTTLLVEWIAVLTRGLINDPKDLAHLPILTLINETARAASFFNKALYRHGFFLPKSCSKVLYGELRKFLTGYNKLAHRSLNSLNFRGYAMKPKIHMLSHLALELKTWNDDPTIRCMPSPLMTACESNEDVVGRVSRIARRVHQGQVCRSTIERYLIKAKALYERWRKPLEINPRKRKLRAV